MPRALFYGLAFAAVALGLVEAVHLLAHVPTSMPPSARFLAALHALSPFCVGGILVAGVVWALATLWVRARRVTDLDTFTNRAADLTAALISVGAFGAGLFVAALLVRAHLESAALGGLSLALSTPALALLSFYLWAVLRAQLSRLDARFQARVSPVIGLAILGTTAALLFVTLRTHDALVDEAGGAAPLMLLAYVGLTVVGVAILRQWSPGRRARVGLDRALFVVAIFGGVGLVDVVAHMDSRPGVKQALLEHTWLFRPLVVRAQPLFDADGDGYAGRLGGGDCDDGDPRINPGAREVPRNGVDEDCFGGDSPGTHVRPPRIEWTVVPNAPRRVKRPNIIMITVDTLRADHLGYQGYTKHPTSPNIDALAAQGLRFRWAFAQGPQTKVSIPSMFTGRYYSEVERTPHLWAQVLPENVTLAERLRDAGYHTAGIASHRFFLPSYGLNQGFDHWDLSIVKTHGRRTPHVITGQEVTRRALAWLQTNESEPFFLWLHYFDPHHFYQDHPEFDFGSTDEDLYDEEIAYTDLQIGHLLTGLRASRFADNTYIMLNSDHGEGFQREHGYRYHGQNLHNDQIRVPLLLVGPGLPSSSISAPVSLLDVVPTLLDLVGLPKAKGLRGMSLLPFANARPPVHPPVFSEMVKDSTHSARRVIIDWPWKLQYAITFNRYFLFNLADDPQEKENLVKARPKVFERMRRTLRIWMSEGVEPATPRPR